MGSQDAERTASSATPPAYVLASEDDAADLGKTAYMPNTIVL